MDEKQPQDIEQENNPKETPVKTPVLRTNPGGKDELNGEKIKRIADRTGLFVDLAFIVVGVLIWGRYDNLKGFIIGFLTMCGGVFISYVLVSVLYSYGDMVSNSIEQTKILRRLEAKKLSEFLPQEQEEAAAPLAAETPALPADAAGETAEETKEAAEDWGQVSLDIADPKTVEPSKPPLRGVFDARMRRVAHFAERSRHGIICPICERIQDSNRNDCYFCDCKFVYDDEPFNNSSYQVTDRLRY